MGSIPITRSFLFLQADMAELADAPDLGSGGQTRAGSNPVIRIVKELVFMRILALFYYGIRAY